jgi:hypothetical protein
MSIPKSKQALEDALILAREALTDLELSRTTLASIALKASRLARLLNDSHRQKLFQFEASGYPHPPSGYPKDIWEMLKNANRVSSQYDAVSKKTKETGYYTSIAYIEQALEANKLRLTAAVDPSVSISSANPRQFVTNPIGNQMERQYAQNQIVLLTEQLSQRSGFLHEYLADTYIELKYSHLSEDAFSRIRQQADARIALIAADAAQKLTAIYENLASENPEDWANAVHGCRRILQTVADSVYPARDPIAKEINGKKQKIKLGPKNYINRLIAYVEEHAGSRRYMALVGSHLSFLGNRLDAVFDAAQKGSHAEIVDRIEADRYVVYTYMLVGDILLLGEDKSELKIGSKLPAESEGE